MAGHYGGVVHLQYGSSIEIFDSTFENNQASIDGGVFDCFNLKLIKADLLTIVLDIVEGFYLPR